jgi:hypothetical protein
MSYSDKDLLGAKKTKEKFPEKYLKYCIGGEIDPVIIWQKVGGIILIFLPDIISTIKRSLLGEEWTKREL